MHHQAIKLQRAVAIGSIVTGAAITAYAMHLEREDAAYRVSRFSANATGFLAASGKIATMPAAVRHIEPTQPTARARVVIGPVAYTAVRAARPQDASCVGHWRQLESGPVGRYVIATCAGTQAPPPPVGANDVSRVEQVPSLRDFAVSLGRLPEARLQGDPALAAARSDLLHIADDHHVT